MTNTITLDDEQLAWLRIALENSLESAKRLAQSDDINDQLDAGLLVQKYTELAEVVGTPPEVGL